MTCKTCVEMTITNQDMGQEIMALRRSNNVLVDEVEALKELNSLLGKRNRILVRKNNALQDQADAMFEAICELEQDELGD